MLTWAMKEGMVRWSLNGAGKVLMSDDSAEMLSQGESLHGERKCKLERLLDKRYPYTRVKRNY